MTTRQRRMVFVALIVLCGGGAAAFGLRAFQENMMFFVTPSDMLGNPDTNNKTFRLGGMVKEGTVRRADGSLDVTFTVTDMKHDLPVTYTGVLPDLFREGQGVIARGRFVDGAFRAEEVLAKHDEKYMPPEVAKRIATEHGGTMPTPKP